MTMFGSAAASLVLISCTASAQQTLTNERTLTHDAALMAATTALKKCRADGLHTSVTVLDAAGRTKVVLSDDGARPHTVEHSLRKAYTSLTYEQSSRDYGARAAANPRAAGTLHLANVTTAPGGYPIRAGQEVVGAIGVSGSPTGDKDEACAQAGIDSLRLGG